jgi:hypothetical protein
MNLSGNYSQIRGSINRSIKEEPEIKEKPPLPIEKPTAVVEKSSVFDRNPSGFTASNVSDRRPRVNASLNGPMNQKIDNSVKIDNYLRSDPTSDDNIPPPNKPAKPI